MHNGCPDCHEISPSEIELCPKHWTETQEDLRKIYDDSFFDVAGANVGPSEVRPTKDWNILVTAMIRKNILDEIVFAARLSAELSPRVPDGNKFGYDWTIPNPVIVALAKLDAWEKENGGTEVKSNVKEP